jgi:hypothetical protein
MSGKKAKEALKRCIKRDGSLCAKCGKKPARILHHVDNNPENNPADMTNWEGRCQPCNIKSHPRGVGKRGIRARHKMILLMRESARECESEPESTKVQVQTKEMEKNSVCEPKFREWLADIIEDVGTISIEDAVNGGAEYVQCSPQTVKRYLDKLCSFTGGYEYYANEEGKRFVRLKQVKEKTTILPITTIAKGV